MQFLFASCNLGFMGSGEYLMVLFFTFVILIPAADFLVKFWIQNNVPEHVNFPTLLPFLSVTCAKNFGAAFSSLWGGRYFLIFASVLAIFLLLYFVFIKKIRNKLFLLACAFTIGGGMSNLTDRIFFGYVVDYLKLSFFGPVCNISDYFITLGGVIFIFYFLAKKD